ncbi:hypothetical protein C8A00DRAFT_13784 [Chaetomidium leptoderma]|uniref:Uncharacterized protein n=1 Tax=Chaetomidium leptoderma TaxID=669021 RepID=A0AAN6VQP5_9PEZI|nr:hypothetical protein C8A00DRAFT_13784 [Chaetomidium leptoderma]
MFRRTLQRLQPPPKLADVGFTTNFDNFRIAPRAATSTVITQKALQEFSPSEKVIKFAAEHNITFPSALRLVPGQKFAEFPMRFTCSNRHVFSYFHLKYLAQFEHPLTEKTLHFYTQQKQSRPLWCYVQGSSVSDGCNAVVRNASERAVRAALFRGLNAAGYDSSGRSLHGAGRSLRGTIRIGVSQPKAILKFEFDQLLGYVTRLVANAVPRLGGLPPPGPFQ